MLTPTRSTPELEAASGLLSQQYVGGEAPRALVILAHGRAGDFNVMWIFSKAVAAVKPVVFSPQAFLADPIGGWSWWQAIDSGDVKKSGPADLGIAVERLERYIATIRLEYPGLPVIGFGFSQGAALLGMLSIERPGLFRGVAMLSGFLPKSFMSMRQTLPDLSGTSYYIFHGRKDEVVLPARSESAGAAFRESGAEVELLLDDVGHKVSSSGIRGLTAWFTKTVG